jgi:hypothetical protein
MKPTKFGIRGLGLALVLCLTTGWVGAQFRPYLPPAGPITPPIAPLPNFQPLPNFEPLPNIQPLPNLEPIRPLPQYDPLPQVPFHNPGYSNPPAYAPSGGGSVPSYSSPSSPAPSYAAPPNYSTPPSYTPQPAPPPSPSQAEINRNNERERVRNKVRSAIAQANVDALRTLNSEGSVLDASERASLAADLVRALRQKNESGDPWQVLRLATEAQQIGCGEAASALDDWRRSVEGRCLIPTLHELALELKTRHWSKGRRLADDKLQQLPSLADARNAVPTIIEIGQQADRLDRLSLALQSSGPEAADAWKSVPIGRLPTEWQARARALRGWVLLRDTADRPWVKRPEQAELKQALQEFRAGAWNPTVADQVQLRLGRKALDHGFGTIALDLLHDFGDRLTPEQAGAQLRDMQRQAFQADEPGSGGATPRGPPAAQRIGIASMVPQGNSVGWRPSSHARSFAPEFSQVEPAAVAARESLATPLGTARQELRRKLEPYGNHAVTPLVQQLFRPAPPAGGPGGGGGFDGPLLAFHVQPSSDDEKERQQLLARLQADMSMQLSSAERWRALQLHREGDEVEAILAALKAR